MTELEREQQQQKIYVLERKRKNACMRMRRSTGAKEGRRRAKKSTFARRTFSSSMKASAYEFVSPAQARRKKEEGYNDPRDVIFVR